MSLRSKVGPCWTHILNLQRLNFARRRSGRLKRRLGAVRGVLGGEERILREVCVPNFVGDALLPQRGGRSWL